MRRAFLSTAIAVGLLSGAPGTSAPGAHEGSHDPGPAFRADRAAAPPAETGEPEGTAILSNERTLSRWAYVPRRLTAKARPRPGARVVKRLRSTTADGTPELVLALRQRQVASGATWVLVRLPMRPNGSKGWVRRGGLGAFHVVRTRLVIDRDNFTISLYRRGHRVVRARIGVGTPDAPTPVGRFYVRERLIPIRRNTVYGVFAFGTSAFSPAISDWPGGGIIGVHGTNQPELIPGRVSHGCVRVRNKEIRKLKRRTPLGTPIRIR